MSQEHFRIERRGGSYFIDDLESTNGTQVDGQPVVPGTSRLLEDLAVIRAGQCVLVFRTDAASILDATLAGRTAPLGLAGRFHMPALLRQLMEAALSFRPPLLAGASGSGKELAAAVLASLWGMDKPRRYNVASAATPEELSRVLFGVASKAFTGVGEQSGLIVTAAREGRPLFLDEVHNLPGEAQATVLTVIEDGRFARKGSESDEVQANVKFVFASNEPDKLKHDLRARMWRIDLPSLRDRVADVPELFEELVSRQLARHGISAEPVRRVLDVDVMYELCLEVVRGKTLAETNVRGLQDIADRIASRIAAGLAPEDAVDSVWVERIGPRETEDDSGASHYERHRELITAVFLGAGKNASRTVELLRDAGLPWTISRRHLTLNVERWGLK